jgi:hypothetical protein
MKNESTSGNREVKAGGQNPLPEDRSKLQNTTGPTPPMPPTIQFQKIPIGQHFEFRGRRYQKLALSMASDEDRNGAIFQAQTEVLPDPLPEVDLPSEFARRQPQAKPER